MLKIFLNCSAIFTNTNKERFTSEYESAMKKSIITKKKQPTYKKQKKMNDSKNRNISSTNKQKWQNERTKKID